MSFSFEMALAFEFLGLKSPAYQRHGLQNEGGVGGFDVVSWPAAKAHMAIKKQDRNRVASVIGQSSFNRRHSGTVSEPLSMLRLPEKHANPIPPSAMMAGRAGACRDGTVCPICLQQDNLSPNVPFRMATL